MQFAMHYEDPKTGRGVSYSLLMASDLSPAVPADEEPEATDEVDRDAEAVIELLPLR